MEGCFALWGFSLVGVCCFTSRVLLVSVVYCVAIIILFCCFCSFLVAFALLPLLVAMFFSSLFLLLCTWICCTWAEVLLHEVVVNVDELQLLYLHVIVVNVDEMATIMGCGTSSFPTTYPGLPRWARYKASTVWNGVIDRVEKKIGHMVNGIPHPSECWV